MVSELNIFLESLRDLSRKKKNGAVDASTHTRVHASTRRIHAGQWTLCTHPPFLGLHACNKMGSTPVLPSKIRQNQHKKNFFLRGNFGHPTSGSGGKIGLKIYHMKRDKQINIQTYIQRTSRLYDRIGPVGRFDENLLFGSNIVNL